MQAVTRVRGKPDQVERESGIRTIKKAGEALAVDVWSTADIPDGISGAKFSTADNESSPIPYVWDNSSLHQLLNKNREGGIAAATAGFVPQDRRIPLSYIGAAAFSLVGLIAAVVMASRRSRRI